IPSPFRRRIKDEVNLLNDLFGPHPNPLLRGEGEECKFKILFVFSFRSLCFSPSFTKDEVILQTFLE
ncbi:hypothetical protein C4577_02625, partial [Candidatus Parcubacteria bacterium]